MRYREAKKLNVNDYVLIQDGKKDFRSVRITDIKIEDRDVFVRCTDGAEYHHTVLKEA